MITLVEVLTNKIFYTPIVAWMSCQVIKVILHYIQYRKIDLTLFYETGRMPSAHAGTVSALSTMIGLTQGWTSPLFVVCLYFSLIVMYDAAGLRRAAGEQARVMNIIIGDIYRGRKLKAGQLKELVGHTPVEVIAGSIYGILLAVVCY